MDLQTLVNQQQSKFSETEREILSFMLQNESIIAEATISSLAAQTFTSTSSIIRLTKKLGFTGFAELKYFVKNSLAQLTPQNSNFLQSGRNDIEQTLKWIEDTDIHHILRMMHRARTVYCFGTGYAQRNAIQEFAKSMLACGKFMHVIPAKTEFAGALSAMGQDDVVIVVSLSGNTASVLDTIKTLSMRRIPLIALTAESINAIASYATYNLHYRSTPTRLPGQSKPYHSFVALNILLDYMVRQYIELLDQEDQL
ncbi:MurR/RpiR family transcriptional regulator [uncultured Rothia sp.]|uniref:MurR/RpiR family transcriptional regulator n=1 Tax=uncultured Rothia sp. TaxID=316088 RepID=UPI003217D616